MQKYVVFYPDTVMKLYGRHGRERKLPMYQYVTDKDFLKRLRGTCGDIVNQLVQRINRDSEMTVSAHLVGSGGRNLVTQNAKGQIDLDYNLYIERSKTWNEREIKEHIRKKFNEVLQSKGWGDCRDSTSVLTTEWRRFKKGNKTDFRIDLAIIRKDYLGQHRLIHYKTGYINLDQYYWNLAPYAADLEKKVTAIKSNNLWDQVRDRYLAKKNFYLSKNDYAHPSFIVYIEAVNEVYQQVQQHHQFVYSVGGRYEKIFL